VGERFPVLFDSGIRTGADVVKALALGARAVLIGRPAVWGLAVDGEAGVRDVLTLLRAELARSLALLGCTGPTQVGREHVRAVVPYDRGA
jgi:isopentenyl diphosphate isomerase/L-lactate dehydrogenase-like FMN-dependent dehydrogenase